MKINYALVCFKPINDDEVQVKHICCYENEPSQSDVDSLYNELAKDEEFNMVGDEDFEMKLISREERPDIFETLKIPLEMNENEKDKN